MHSTIEYRNVNLLKEKTINRLIFILFEESVIGNAVRNLIFNNLDFSGAHFIFKAKPVLISHILKISQESKFHSGFRKESLTNNLSGQLM